jgi:HAE1 family hydrophobic/amphiphilic exporter-1
MRQAGGYADFDLSWQTGKPELQIVPDRGAMADLGVDAAQVGEAVRLLVGGDKVATFTDHGDRYDVVVRLADDQRRDPGDVLEVPLRTNAGQLVTLRSLAKVQERSGPLQIDRYGRSRQVTISANLVHVKSPQNPRTLTLGDAKDEVLRFAAEAGLPPGSSVAVIGMAEVMDESFANLTFALGLAVVMVFLVLASQFEHLLHPFTIMLSLPLALVGALGLLAATGSTLSIFTMIGIIMLMGLVTKNAILLVDYTNTLRRRDGLARDDALRRAGPVRLRPILMTTLAMIAGMAPIALGTGAGSESRSPMAITVIGGLITSTLLTLVVVPVVYTYLDGLGTWFENLFARRTKEHEASVMAGK